MSTQDIESKIDWHPRDLMPKTGNAPIPANYILSPGLEAALRVAVSLGQPLLLTGEPGTGKTQLAYKAAYEFAQKDNSFFKDDPLIFHTKTTSAAKDLLYSYDAVRHFHDASRKEGDVRDDQDYISLAPLGEAILLSMPEEKRGEFAGRWPDDLQARSTVVLVDEIDKAPRDFPNDLLHELDQFEFSIPEIKSRHGKPFARNKDQQILVIITSNSEKNLPEAFLRRCVFFHLPTPDGPLLAKILARHRDDTSNAFPKAEAFLIERYFAIRKEGLSKPPATAELINWMRFLRGNLGATSLMAEIEKFGGFPPNPDALQAKLLRASLSTIAKTEDDLRTVQKLLNLMDPK